MSLGGGNIIAIEALRNYVDQVSKSILNSYISPKNGVNLIWQSIRNARTSHNFDEFNEFHELDGFIYTADEMDERPEDKDLFKKAIIVEAECWIDRCS